MTKRRAAREVPELRDLSCACASARRMARHLTSIYDRGLRDTGIDAPQFALLATIAQEGPCTQATLGRLHALDKSTASRNLTVLHQSGWVDFSTTGDGREWSVALTPSGKRQVKRSRLAWQRAQDDIRRAMTEAQWAAMFKTFRAVSEAHRSRLAGSG